MLNAETLAFCPDQALTMLKARVAPSRKFIRNLW
jgi:hypothetical protein